MAKIEIKTLEIAGFRSVLEQLGLPSDNVRKVIEEKDSNVVYRDVFSKIGIYAIVINNKLYIGSTSIEKGISERINQHRWALHGYRHKNTYMQNLYNKYKSIVGYSLLVCDDADDVINIEQFILDNVKTDINICVLACNSSKGVKRSNDTKIKMSLSQKGRVFSKEHINRLSESHKGFVMSEEQKKKISIANTGKKMSDENVRRLSKPIVQYSLDGEIIKEYPSTMQVSRELGICSNSIQQCANGKYNHITAYGYIWRYKGDSFYKYPTKAIKHSERNWDKVKRKIKAIFADGREVVYDSVKEASDSIGVNRHTISRAIRENRKTKNIHFVYVENK